MWRAQRLVPWVLFYGTENLRINICMVEAGKKKTKHYVLFAKTYHKNLWFVEYFSLLGFELKSNGISSPATSGLCCPAKNYSHTYWWAWISAAVSEMKRPDGWWCTLDFKMNKDPVRAESRKIGWITVEEGIWTTPTWCNTKAWAHYYILRGKWSPITEHPRGKELIGHALRVDCWMSEFFSVTKFYLDSSERYDSDDER